MKAKRTIKVGFKFFWPSFNPRHFIRWFFPFLADEFAFELAEEPQLYIASAWRPRPRPRPRRRTWREAVAGKAASAPTEERDVPHLWWSGENLPVDMTEWDFALSHNIIDNPRHHRCPYWVPHLYGMGHTPEALLSRAPRVPPERAFCNFLYSNRVKFREEFMQRLARYKRVEVGGESGASTGTSVAFDDNDFTRHNKVAYLRQFDFTIAFENESSRGYATEKIIDPFLADSLPIYWGDPLIAETFNPDSFLDYGRFPDFESLLSRIEELVRDRHRYEEMLAQPCFRDGIVPAYATREAITRFFHEVADHL
jgi:hypothetical protein